MHRSSARVPAAAAVAVLLAACAPELNWRDWRSDEVGVRQSFPCKPVRQQRQLQLAGNARTLVLQVCDAGGASWALAHTQVGDPGAVPAVIDALGQAAAANLGVERPPVVALAVAGATPQPGAGVMHISGRAPDGKPMVMATSLFVRGTVVFQVTALGPSLSRDAADLFLQSSRVGP